MGISLENRFVEIYDKERGDIFKSNRKLVGQIVSYNEEVATVIKEGIEEKYELSELYLENSHDNRQDVLSVFLGTDKADLSFKALKNTTQERSGAKGVWESITEFQEWLKKLNFSNKHGFSFNITDFIQSYDHLWQKIEISKPVFIFNIQNSQKDNWHDRGLREYGPYSKTNFTPSNPKIAIVFREINRGQVSKFIGKFKNGIPDVSNKGYQPYGQGFASKYRLSNIDIKPYPVESDNIDSYEKTVRRLIEEIGDEVDLVIIESCQRYKTLPPDKNPYFFTKAQLLKHGIPSQVVLLENMNIADKNLVYILNTDNS